MVWQFVVLGREAGLEEGVRKRGAEVIWWILKERYTRSWMDETWVWRVEESCIYNVVNT